MAILDEEEVPKPKNKGGSVLSIFLSIYFMVRGGMYLSDGNSFGWVMVVLGLGSFCFKIYEMVMNNSVFD